MIKNKKPHEKALKKASAYDKKKIAGFKAFRGESPSVHDNVPPSSNLGHRKY